MISLLIVSAAGAAAEVRDEAPAKPRHKLLAYTPCLNSCYSMRPTWARGREEKGREGCARSDSGLRPLSWDAVDGPRRSWNGQKEGGTHMRYRAALMSARAVG
jgi:hypothetical protein